MRLIEHRETGERQAVEATDGYDLADWIDRGEVPANVPAALAAWDGAAIAADLSGPIEAAQAAISARFVQATLAGCASPKGWVDCDEIAQGRVTRLVELLQRADTLGMETPATVDFTMYDKTRQPHTLEELIALGMTIGFHFLALFARKQALEAALAVAETLADIEAIDVEADWP